MYSITNMEGYSSQIIDSELKMAFLAFCIPATIKTNVRLNQIRLMV